MTVCLLVFSMVVVLSALAVVVRSIIKLRAELLQTAGIGSERIARFRKEVIDIESETEHLSYNLKLLTEVTKELPQAVAVMQETGLLVRNIKTLGAVAAMVSTFRKAPW